MEQIRKTLIRIWRGIIVRADVYVLRNPYSRCKYVAIEKYGDCICRGELLSRSFESLCREFDIEIPSYHNTMTAGKFCRWYMSFRLSWITTRSIMVGKSSHNFNDLPVPRCLSLAKEYIDRDLETAKYWSRYLNETTKQAPVRHETFKIGVNNNTAPQGPQRKKLSIDFRAVENESRRNAETLEIINRHFTPNEVE